MSQQSKRGQKRSYATAFPGARNGGAPPAKRRRVVVPRNPLTMGGGARPASSFAAVAYASGQRVREPQISANGRSSRIRHRELVATVSGSVSFGVPNSLELNPGLAASFPWLSTQAQGWEQYRFHKLCYEYRTRTAATTVGSVLLAPDYDSLDAPPGSEAVASAYRDSVEDAPWKDQDCILDPTALQPMGPRKYVRTTAVATSDLKTYDGGVMHVCTVGMVGTDAVGKLWVEYDVEFFVPQLGAGTQPANRTLGLYNLSADSVLATATATTVPFDELVANPLGVVNTSGVFTLPGGSYLVRAELAVVTGSGTATAVATIEKDGAALSVPCQTSILLGTTGFALVVSGYVTSAGSNTTRIRITVTNASGSINLKGDNCRVYITAV